MRKGLEIKKQVKPCRLTGTSRRAGRLATITMKSGLTWGSFLCIICLYRVVSGPRDAADGHLFVSDAGDVVAGGPGPSPCSQAWHAD